MVMTQHVKIFGRVQGVWYRAWALEVARELGLVGWVRNCDDGTVEAMVQGEGSAVQRFIELAHQGSRLAQVDQVDATECETIALSSFEQRP